MANPFFLLYTIDMTGRNVKNPEKERMKI